MSQPPSAPCCLAPVSLAPDSRPRTWAQHRCTDADWHVSQPGGWSTRGSLSSPGLCFLISEATVMALTPPPSWGCWVGLIAEPWEDSEWATGPARPWGRPSLYTRHSQLAPLLQGPSMQRGLRERGRAGSEGDGGPLPPLPHGGAVSGERGPMRSSGKRAWHAAKPHPSGQTLTTGRRGWLDFRGCWP